MSGIVERALGAAVTDDHRRHTRREQEVERVRVAAMDHLRDRWGIVAEDPDVVLHGVVLPGDPTAPDGHNAGHSPRLELEVGGLPARVILRHPSHGSGTALMVREPESLNWVRVIDLAHLGRLLRTRPGVTPPQ